MEVVLRENMAAHYLGQRNGLSSALQWLLPGALEDDGPCCSVCSFSVDEASDGNSQAATNFSVGLQERLTLSLCPITQSL